MANAAGSRQRDDWSREPGYDNWHSSYRRSFDEAAAAVGENAISLSNLVMTLDDTAFTGSLAVPRGNGSYRVNVEAEAFDLNRYMAPPSEEGGEAAGEAVPVELPADLVRTLNARGEIRIASLTLGSLLLEQAAATLNASNGRLRIHPVSAGLYGGQYSGDISFDATGNKPALSFNEQVQNVDLARLAEAMFDQENITGTMRGEFKLSGRGNDTLELQQSLRGTMSFELLDGTYEGTDVWYELRRARAKLKQETPPEPVLPARTRFSSVTATGVVTDGVMRNDDLIAELPFMQLTGSGNVNLVGGTVDYGLKARVFKKPEALEEATAEEIDDFTKAVIPLRISGPLSAPKVSPDVEALLRQRVEEEIEEKLKDKLKDLFN